MKTLTVLSPDGNITLPVIDLGQALLYRGKEFDAPEGQESNVKTLWPQTCHEGAPCMSYYRDDGLIILRCFGDVDDWCARPLAVILVGEPAPHDEAGEVIESEEGFSVRPIGRAELSRRAHAHAKVLSWRGGPENPVMSPCCNQVTWVGACDEFLLFLCASCSKPFAVTIGNHPDSET